MNSFVNAIKNQDTVTENGMPTHVNSGTANTDLFFKIGASRGKNIIPDFVAAFVENEDYALRIAQWARDIRGGAGERQLFKDILSYLEQNYPHKAIALINKIPTIGRWDDMLIDYKNEYVRDFAYSVYNSAILEGDALAAKWAPRKGINAVRLRKAWDMSPRQYRKFIVNATHVVETAMCEKRWDEIDFSKLPSLAHSRYKTAFYRNALDKYTKYIDALSSGDKSVKINAGAVYPYDVLKAIGKVPDAAIDAQWDAMPNYIEDANIFPMIDVSGSMTCSAGGNPNLSAMDVAISLGLYCADKNTGAFKDSFLTFSSDPSIECVHGSISQKMHQIRRSNWGMSTNISRAFEKLLRLAIDKQVRPEDMPDTLLIFSDMQFDACASFNARAKDVIDNLYSRAGYEVPKLVFWNLRRSQGVPVKFDEQGTALVSGFSPTILKSILGSKSFTPQSIMLEAIMDSRYDL